MGRTSDAKERLIDTAVVLIRARSYTSVSVDDICKTAGVRKGSFYHFFPSKRDLALAVVDSWWESMQVDVLDPAFQGDVPPLERIQRMFDRAVTLHSKAQQKTGQFQGCPLGNLALEVSSQDEVMREKLDHTFQQFSAYIENALKMGVSDGSIPPNLNVRETAQSLLSYFYGIIMMAKTANDSRVMKDLSSRALQLVSAPLA
ncbi:MAG: TetR/AcrR family transcriptional regulator [SAR324 cluster bacterium]|nr:TetR/AcrR family transcriptional regulator [SAR324 cluster bacterium]MCH8885537.1 TetR/AcrR family transcriptional regulator [SAR324 cluster bacterium]